MVVDYEASKPSPDPVESVRGRPGMWIGDTSGWGRSSLVLEIAANGVDQFLRGLAMEVSVVLDGGRFVVVDDGAGLDRGKARRHLEAPHFTATADLHAPHIHMGDSRIGMFPVNALCREFTMESFDSEGSWRLRYERGRLVEEAAVERERGTRVEAVVDSELFGQVEIPLWRVRHVLFDAAHLFPGLRLRLNEETFHAPGGLEDLARFEAARVEGRGWREGSDRFFGHTHDGAELSFTTACYGTVSNVSEVNVSSWVNGRRSPGHGTHVDGALDALKEIKWFPAALMLSVVMKEPEYAGPTKDRLRAERARPLVRDAFFEACHEATLRA